MLDVEKYLRIEDSSVSATNETEWPHSFTIPHRIEDTTITRIDDHAFDWENHAIRYGISQLIIEEGIEEIGKYAFYHCTNLQTVILPNSLKHIDDYAFCGCTNLYLVNQYSHFSNDPYARYSHTLSEDLQTLYVKRIGKHAFENCILNNASHLHRGRRAGISCYSKIIDEYAFAKCHGLNAMYFEYANDTTLYNYCFQDSSIDYVFMSRFGDSTTIAPFTFDSNWKYTEEYIDHILARHYSK